jgi:hypothetical protein
MSFDPIRTTLRIPEKHRVHDHIRSVLIDTVLGCLDAIMSDQSVRRPARSAAWYGDTS